MKRRTKKIVAFGVLLLLLIGASIPRVSGVRTESVEQIAAYPALQSVYDGQPISYPDAYYDMEPSETIQIVTVSNLWGSRELYILPCFATRVLNIGIAGSSSANAFFEVVTAWSEENLFSALLPVKVKDFGVRFEPGNNTFVYQDAEVSPFEILVPSDDFVIADSFRCDEDSQIMVSYSTATQSSDLKREEVTEATFTWQYTLTSLGREIYTGEHSITQEYIVNG